MGNFATVQIDEEGFLNETQKLANPEDFIGFLNLCANNITMSFRNQIALYKQAKDIRNACGIRARTEMQQENSKDIAIATVFYYNLKQADDFSLVPEYVPIKVVGNTVPRKEELMKEYAIPDMIAKTGFTVETVSKARLKHPINKADYDVEKKIIQVANTLNKRQHAEALISAFTKICLESRGIEDKIIQVATDYVVSKYFNVAPKGGIRGMLFNQAFTYSKKDFAELLEQISMMSLSVIEALIGQLLSFDETSIINAYLSEENANTFSEEIYEMQDATKDERTIKILSELREKIDDSTVDSMDYLVSLKERNGSVYTYPPFRFQRRQEFLG